jgi:hypothetical protein
MPLLAILLGVAGLIPFIVCGLGAISANQGQAAVMLAALVGYGAVALSFLGGIHWGFALWTASAESEAAVPPDARAARVRRMRLLLGVVPSLIGWVALLIQMALPDWTALVVLIAGFLATVIVEHQAAQRTLIHPARYMWLRWGLTIVVIAMLVTVLTLRLLGPRIILW